MTGARGGPLRHAVHRRDAGIPRRIRDGFTVTSPRPQSASLHVIAEVRSRPQRASYRG